MTVPIFTTAGIGILTRSLDFGSGNNRFLSISSANFNYSSMNKDKAAWAGVFRIPSLAASRRVFIKGTSSFDFGMEVQATGAVTFAANSGTPGSPWQFQSTTGVVTAGNWGAYLIHFDRNNGTSSERLKIWVNNSPLTAAQYGAPTGSLSSGTDSFRYGYDGGQELNGLLYSAAVFSNYLPSTSEIFDGSSGKVKNMAGITGLHSLLDTRNGIVTSDFVLAADWTNNNGVVASFGLP